MCEQKRIYRLNDDISFRKCNLFDGKKKTHGDCTCFSEIEEDWHNYYDCNQYGIHLQCTKHPAIELNYVDNITEKYLICRICKKKVLIDNFNDILLDCLKLLNVEQLKDATLIRLDDWYIPEVKQRVKVESGYWIATEIKTDKDGDTIIVVYVGHKDTDQKAQFFIKPEKLQLTNDHKDMDPAQIISKIEVTLKDRLLKHEYD